MAINHSQRQDKKKPCIYRDFLKRKMSERESEKSVLELQAEKILFGPIKEERATMMTMMTEVMTMM